MSDDLRLASCSAIFEEDGVELDQPFLERSVVRNLLGKRGNPYYIVSPTYAGNSAGIRALFILCKELNRAGFRAYMVNLGHTTTTRPYIGLDYAVPVLTAELQRAYEEAGVTPIVVYPEVVEGNPLGAACVVRYLLNFPGALGGATAFAEDEQIWAYGGLIAEALGTDRILTIPISDPDYWKLDHGEATRNLSAHYGPKYKELGGTWSIPEDEFEITRLWPQGDELREFLMRCKSLTIYENTALAIEGCLAGVDVCWSNADLESDAILQFELGPLPTKNEDPVGSTQEPNRFAQEFRSKYLQLFCEFHEQLERFVADSQLFVASCTNPRIETQTIFFSEGLSFVQQVEMSQERDDLRTMVADLRTWVSDLEQVRDGLVSQLGEVEKALSRKSDELGRLKESTWFKSANIIRTGLHRVRFGKFRGSDKKQLRQLD